MFDDDVIFICFKSIIRLLINAASLLKKILDARKSLSYIFHCFTLSCFWLYYCIYIINI